MRRNNVLDLLTDGKVCPCEKEYPNVLDLLTDGEVCPCEKE